MLADYMEQKPDRNIRAAPAELIRLHEEMKEHLKAFRAAAASNILPVSILGALDSLSNEAALKVNGYLATVARYLTYTDRFSKNKRGLVFFARHMLPRLLQLFALQLDACRHLWRFLSFASPRETLTGPLTFKPSLSPSGAAAAAAAAAAAGAAEGADEDSTFGSEVDPSAAAAAAAAAHAPSLPVALTVHDSEAGGPLRTLAQNLGVHLPTVPHADARAFGRRLLARVQVHIGALYALAQGCLAATALSFQREYAEAEDRVELGEAPAAAFLSLRGQSECVEKSSSKKSKGKETAKENAAEESGRDGQPTEPQKKQSHRLRALNRGRPAGSAATAAAAAGNPNDAERTS
ncbi:kelch motif domain-containing protein, putative [Eimeria necatrix]|uniref:Kelch motif domain-containing protein, putative n=1 Tax=Eimeria necatrix TaxID=51315 RepID=U6MXZ6_9EIME|nr:kelch motif domain-containing protein, putative [Eimeria necatrix]CDJ68846.1 kelch motif domain-containing protein, putative [Eimeria necatrix]